MFDGAALWLEVGVRPGIETGAYTTLAPHQALRPTPNAIYAASADWTGLTGMPLGFSDNIDDDTLAGLGCAIDQVSKWNASGRVCEEDIDTDTTYSAGTGLDLQGTTFVLTDTFQLPQACANGQIIDRGLSPGRVGLGWIAARHYRQTPGPA